KEKELAMGGFGQLPIVEGLELIKEPKKKPIKKRKKKLLLDDEEANRGVYGSLKRDAEIEEFKSKTVKIAPAGLILRCLKACLDDFSHHNIDVACKLLETYSRYLYRHPDTNVRMENMLEILMRLKNVKNLDPRHSTLVENAYYLCKPPERSARVSKVCPPLHQDMHLLPYPNQNNTTTPTDGVKQYALGDTSSDHSHTLNRLDVPDNALHRQRIFQNNNTTNNNNNNFAFANKFNVMAARGGPADHYENGLFSRSLSDLFTRKATNNNSMYGHSVGASHYQHQEEQEPFRSLEEIEA
ncbi:regulator of nonsense transcripts UPF2, partial [Tanacetum coccineum]